MRNAGLNKKSSRWFVFLPPSPQEDGRECVWLNDRLVLGKRRRNTLLNLLFCKYEINIISRSINLSCALLWLSQILGFKNPLNEKAKKVKLASLPFQSDRLCVTRQQRDQLAGNIENKNIQVIQVSGIEDNAACHESRRSMAWTRCWLWLIVEGDPIHHLHPYGTLPSQPIPPNAYHWPLLLAALASLLVRFP